MKCVMRGENNTMCAVCDIHYVSTQVGILCSLRVNEHNIPRRVEQDLRGGHPATGGLVLTIESTHCLVRFSKVYLVWVGEPD